MRPKISIPDPPKLPDVNEACAAISELSPRRKAILGWIVADASNHEIASAFDIGVKLVEKEVSAILRVLNVHTRTGAAVTAVRCELSD